MKMPPATVKSATSRMMKGMYSASSACTRLPPARAGAEHGGKRQQEGQRPGGGDLAEMVVPERRREQRHQRDRQQDAGKRNAPNP
jgi:hypothetical protein